jgi:xanthine/CO dehydrogenase XdhC/CoxF family maturation factor
MHLGIPALLDFYRAHREDDSLVLATVTGTEGSTYRKPGAMMLISSDDRFEGMISGGCLEGDLLQHARQVFETGEALTLTYDMHADEDLAWGLGLGCDGVIHLLLQRLERDSGHGFLRSLERAHEQRDAALLAITTAGPAQGSMALLKQSGEGEGDESLVQRLRSMSDPWPDWRCRTPADEAEANGPGVIAIHLPAQVRVLICGAGPDAVPVAEALAMLDWDVHVVDHRPVYARAERFPAGCTVSQTRPENLREVVEAAGLDAAVIMSHHLENDAEYLRQLHDAGLSYIGLLGPAARRLRLRDRVGCTDRLLHGPAGLDIGAELPAAIALSIASEIHAVLNDRDGRSLTGKCHE